MKTQKSGDLNGPAFVSWDTQDSLEKDKAFKTYSKAIEESSYSVANTMRDFRGLTSSIDGKPGLRSSDFDWFRPGQAAPINPKEIISYARYVYRRIGLIHNAIDLMGDFACQGVRLTHPNKRIERFYNDWFEQVQGRRVSERLAHLLFREANVPIRHYTVKVNKKKKLEMQKTIAEIDLDLDMDDVLFQKNEIPWRYTFIDPLLVEPIGGSLSNLSKKKTLVLKIPLSLKNEIMRLQQSPDPSSKDVLGTIAPDIIQAANSNNQLLILPPDKTNIYYYKKDDWQIWADPMTYSAFEPLNLYQRLQLADKAALDGAMNKIRVWKLGSLEHKLAPTPTASTTLAGMLGANVGGGTIDIVWGPDIELLETSSDIQSYLGQEKYVPTLMSIYASLGIPPTLTGTFGSGGTTNNFIALKTLVERLNYVRNILVDFWKEQIKIIQKSMGFKLPASVEFDIMYLEDPASINTLLLNMADRNIISDEFLQRNIKANPEIEARRLQNEYRYRENQQVEKVSPYHQVDQQLSLKKIALQTGLTSPSEVGLKLEERKDGEKSLVDVKTEQMKKKTENQPSNQQQNTAPGQPGRPQNSNDVTKRKTKTFQPKTKASAEVWAKKAQEEISNIINPIILAGFEKDSLRKLTLKENESLEKIKFEILCNLEMGQEINELSIANASNNISNQIHEELNEWLAYAPVSYTHLTLPTKA